MLSDQTPLFASAPRRVPTVAVLKRDLSDWSQMLGDLQSSYQVVWYGNADRFLQHLELQPVDLALVDADLGSKELLRAIRSRHRQVPILCVTDTGYPRELVEARARDYQFRTFAPGESRRSLAGVIDSLISPREHQRIRTQQFVVELPTEGGSYTDFGLLDISNQGCAFEACLDPNGAPFVPDAFYPDIRIRGGSNVVLSGVGARVRNVRPLGIHLPGSIPRFRIGVVFTHQPSLQAKHETTEIIDEEIDILALLSNAVTHSPWHVNLPFVETEGIACGPIRVDATRQLISLQALESIPFAVGDVASVYFEIGGNRYSFFAAIKLPIDAEEADGAFAIGFPSTVKSEANRSSMRYRPALGQVQLTFRSPFCEATTPAEVVDITSRGAGFLVDPGDCVCPIGTALEKVTMRFIDGVEWSGKARVMSLKPSGERTGSVRCGIEFEIDQPNEKHRFVEQLTKSTRPRVSGAGHLSASDLWQFFCDSGFLYPEKLHALSADAAVATLGKVLSAPPSLAQSFVYRTRDDSIGAHMSAIKVYPKTWELQHLAGRQNASVSLMVPELILGVSEYMEQLADISWCRMFFRPNNGWPAYAIGDYVARLGTDESADTTQYAYMVRALGAAADVLQPTGIEIRSYEDTDSAHIVDHFVSRGKVTLMQSLQLEAESIELRSVDAEYTEVGLSRRRELSVAADSAGFRGFSLMEFSSPGLNLSDLTSSFTVNCAEGDTEALLGLGLSAIRRYRDAGYDRAICLADEWQVDALATLGLVRSKDYMCVTWPRSFYRRFHQHAQRKFVR